ncbi:MAG: hypothetical protein QUS33_04085 [Dehalococcoidia bacterium]|nr:hypothetical protein [Dehalococcoidia bacterium]
MIEFETLIAERRPPVVAIDLGYSRSTPSCGIMHADLKHPEALQFGEAVRAAIRLIETHRSLVLVLEAVLSTYHDEQGNPDIRGDFEKGRGWYHGPGVATYAAAIRFLPALRRECRGGATVYLAEAFLSFKKGRTDHAADALTIFRDFWKTRPERLKDRTEPILDFINGVPSVRVFH